MRNVKWLPSIASEVSEGKTQGKEKCLLFPVIKLN